MTYEQNLLEKWRALPEDKQQEVIDFVDFLTARHHSFKNPHLEPAISSEISQSPSQLGIRLQQIREKIVNSGVPLLSAEEVEREQVERRGGYQEIQ